jgi:hypothetical protein
MNRGQVYDAHFNFEITSNILIVEGLERVMGIEPTLVAWEATVLPLNYTRKLADSQ